MASRQLRLSRLHRSVRPAVFLLLAFLLHVGMATACVTEDVTAWMSTPTAAESTAYVAGDDGLPANNVCTHCACHFAIVLPTGAGPLVHLVSGIDAAALPSRVANAPPVPHLRPPIG
jgi:hypothetical protein